MDCSFLKKGLESGLYPALQPIVFSGNPGSGKYAASIALATAFADEKNVFTIQMDADDASLETIADTQENIRRIVNTDRSVEFDLPPLTKALKVANEGEPAVVVFDLNGSDNLNTIFLRDLVSFITSGHLSYGVNNSYDLVKDNEKNLVIMIVKQDELELDPVLDCRCMTIRDFDLSDKNTLGM